MTASTNFLMPFSISGGYNLGAYAPLQWVIDYFGQLTPAWRRRRPERALVPRLATTTGFTTVSVPRPNLGRPGGLRSQ